MKANLTGIPETLFVTLRARAAETKRPDAAVKDPYAVEILEQMEFDESPKNKVSSASQAGIIIRTFVFDKIVTEFILKNPQGVIVNLGCGLDARCKRLPLRGCRWFDIDVEESIEIRRHFFKESSSCQMIARSMFDYTWMDAIPKDRPVLIVAEGVMMFFPEKEIKALVCKLAELFPKVEIAFDTVSEWAVRNNNRHPDIKKFNAPMKWGIDTIQEVESWHPHIRIANVYYYSKYLRKRWPLFIRIVMKLYPPMMKSFRIAHLKLY